MVGYMNPWMYVFDADDVWDHPDKALTPNILCPSIRASWKKQGKSPSIPNLAMSLAIP